MIMILELARVFNKIYWSSMPKSLKKLVKLVYFYIYKYKIKKHLIKDVYTAQDIYEFILFLYYAEYINAFDTNEILSYNRFKDYDDMTFSGGSIRIKAASESTVIYTNILVTINKSDKSTSDIELKWQIHESESNEKEYVNVLTEKVTDIHAMNESNSTIKILESNTKSVLEEAIKFSIDMVFANIKRNRINAK